MAELKGGFEQMLPAFVAGARAGLRAAGEEIMAEADVLVPKDTLTLVNSRFIEEVGERVTIGYGRGDEINPKDGKTAGQYAVPVHEILDARHDPPTSAKYLEIPVVAYEGEFEGTMAAWISRYVEGEGGLVGSFERIV